MSGRFSLTQLGRTALGPVSARADESRRPDRLFDDRLAAAFVHATGSESFLFAENERARLLRAMGDYLAIRTRFFDDYLRQACRQGCRQVVLVAAGLDTRSFRLRLPVGVRVFELDRSDVLDFKEKVLADEAPTPSCQRIVLRTDLADDWTRDLQTAGFRPAEPTAWLVEGLLVYLDGRVTDDLFAALTELSADGSRAGIDDSGAALLRSDAMRAELGDSPPAGITGYSHTVPVRDRLAEHGWRHVIDHDIADLAVRYGRPPPAAFPPSRATTDARGGLVLAER
ncbi:MAG: SAM-dependent methyltransferase [Kutzneria sp.]|nr:SAM-dependent methyltransferase [Kutzneria sp.]